MFALGTIVNTAAIILSGFLGLCFGGLLQPRLCHSNRKPGHQTGSADS